MANILIQQGLYHREFVRRWVNWEQYLRVQHPDREPRFEDFEAELKDLYARYTPEYAAGEAGVSPESVIEVARLVAGAGTALAALVLFRLLAHNGVSAKEAQVSPSPASQDSIRATLPSRKAGRPCTSLPALLG